MEIALQRFAEVKNSMVMRFADGKSDITLVIWDFGGQEVYYVLHHLFITVRHLVRGTCYVVVQLSFASRNYHAGGRLLPLLRHARGQEQHRRVATVPCLLAQLYPQRRSLRADPGRLHEAGPGGRASS